MSEHQIRIKAFGMVAEKIGQSEMAWPHPGHTQELVRQLLVRFPALEGIKFSLAINKKVITTAAEIPLGGEIALLPPFSGG